MPSMFRSHSAEIMKDTSCTMDHQKKRRGEYYQLSSSN